MPEHAKQANCVKKEEHRLQVENNQDWCDRHTVNMWLSNTVNWHAPTMC